MSFTSRLQRKLFKRVPRFFAVINSGLVLVIGFIHFYLWQFEAYKHIPKIGVLFLLNVITAVIFATLIILWPKLFSALLILGFALITLTFYILSLVLPEGIFLFREVSVTSLGFSSIVSEGLLILMNVVLFTKFFFIGQRKRS